MRAHGEQEGLEVFVCEPTAFSPRGIRVIRLPRRSLGFYNTIVTGFCAGSQNRQCFVPTSHVVINSRPGIPLQFNPAFLSLVLTWLDP